MDKNYTLTFGGGAAGHNVTFYLNEVNWNTYGVWGQFRIYINLPKMVQFPYEIEKGRRKTTFVADGSIRDKFGKWNNPKNFLSKKYGARVFTELPDGLCFFPDTHFCWNLLFNFSLKERNEIAKLLHLVLNPEQKKLYLVI